MSTSDSNSSLGTSKSAVYRYTGLRGTRKYFNLVTDQLFGGASDEGNAEEGLEDHLEELLKQTWNIWGVSMLYDFMTSNEVQMKKYAKNLREELAGLLAKENVSYEAKFTMLDMGRPKESDHPPIKIEVFGKVIDKNCSKVTCVYEGYLLSWNSEDFGRLEDECCRLPLVLCRGTANTMKTVHSVLSKMFNCIFVSLSASPEDLRWLVPILLSPGGGNESAKDHDELRLEYTVPGLPNNDIIRMKFKVKSVHNLWISLLQDNCRVDPEMVETFYEILHRQMREVAGLQIGFCLLHKISLPSITIAGNKMKVTSADDMNTVLTYFNEKALELLHIGKAHLRTS